MGYGWSPYVSVADRLAKANRERRKLEKQGRTLAPVVIDGRTIARTFWGQSWCQNLERYSDYANRLPRGRTYVRNGSVFDLQVAAGEVRALVSGSSVYTVVVRVDAVPASRWTSLCTDCAGAIDSLVELLQGRFSKGVMERICQQRTGLFPAPAEIHFSCSCPDWASMCKHVAAVLYGIGARLDEQPELLFLLRRVDQTELIRRAGGGLPLTRTGPATERVLVDTDLSALFGVELEGPAAPGVKAPPPPATRKRKADPPAPAAVAAPAPVTRKRKAVLVVEAAPWVEAVLAPVSARPAGKPARCAFPGCRLSAFVRGEGFCSVHWMMRQDGEIEAAAHYRG